MAHHTFVLHTHHETATPSEVEDHAREITEHLQGKGHTVTHSHVAHHIGDGEESHTHLVHHEA